jgi:hypothetical protein
VVQGTEAPAPAADLAILHVDLTQVPSSYLELARKYPATINMHASDISKRHVSGALVKKGDAYGGQVIVKTDANCGGHPELKHALRRGEVSGPPGRQSWEARRALQNYPLFGTPEAVPAGVWSNPNLVVEHFTPERNEDGEFVVRMWVFLGSRSIHYCCISDEPVIKSGNTMRRELLTHLPVPHELQKRRSELGIDYGKFDYVLVEGKAVLIDANKTPGFPRSRSKSPEQDARIKHLSEGLLDFLSPSQAEEQP